MNAIRSLLATVILLAVFAHHLNAAGDPPERMSYQGYLVDANGVPLGTSPSGDPLPANYDVIFRIFSASSGGSILWAEQQTITVDNGYFSVLLGEGTPNDSEPFGSLSSVFTGIGADERFVAVAVRFEVGGEFTNILPRMRLLSSPYAFLSSQSRSVVNPDGQALITADGGAVTVAGTLTTTQPLTAPSIIASGASLTDIDAGSINAGILNDGRLSANVVRENISNFFASNQYFNGPTFFSGTSNFSSTVSLNANDLRLLSTNDANHGLGWYGTGKLFSGYNIDGPVLYGRLGGALGTSNGTRALRWDNSGRVYLDNGSSTLNFGSNTRQMLNLWGTQYGIGVQSGTLYYRSGDAFAWFRGGSHSDDRFNAGGGTRLANLDGSGNMDLTGYLNTQGFLRTFTPGSTNSSAYTYYWQPNGLYAYTGLQTGSTGTGSGRRYVIGSIGSMNNRSGSSFIAWDGDGNWDFNSDERMKKDIEDDEPVLDRVLDVRLRRFRYKEQTDEEPKKHRGVIAQELQKVFPEMVSESTNGLDDEIYLTVAYGDFGLLAVGAIQELAAHQEEVNAALRAENAELRTALAELQAAVAALAEAQTNGL